MRRLRRQRRKVIEGYVLEYADVEKLVEDEAAGGDGGFDPRF